MFKNVLDLLCMCGPSACVHSASPMGKLEMDTGDSALLFSALFLRDRLSH